MCMSVCLAHVCACICRCVCVCVPVSGCLCGSLCILVTLSVCMNPSVCLCLFVLPSSRSIAGISAVCRQFLLVLRAGKCLTIGSQSKGWGALCLMFADLHESIAPALSTDLHSLHPEGRVDGQSRSRLPPGCFGLGLAPCLTSLCHPILHWLPAQELLL